MANMRDFSPQEFIGGISEHLQQTYLQNKVILSFPQFLALVEKSPSRYVRNASCYLVEMFNHFGREQLANDYLGEKTRLLIFDQGTHKCPSIIGGETCQKEIFNILNNFARSGYNAKLIMLHGPNGSAKTSTINTIANGMEKYSHSDEGAIYRFNWVFPRDKTLLPNRKGDSTPIGFGAPNGSGTNHHDSYALLDESKIAAKIISDFKENPLFLLPQVYRERALRAWIAAEHKLDPAEVTLPPHMVANGLAKQNQLIFNNLLNGYNGNLASVLNHVQVERFFFSKQYRLGISTIEPQLSIDARDKQLTIDQNYANLPAILQTINFYHSQGELVDANRGILEFSDLLKRPVDTFKYLLTTIEQENITLPSGTAALDIVFFATSNDKHLDAFKTIPDFSSFKDRIELVTAPFLLLPSQEQRIYQQDIADITKSKAIAPHSLELLTTWAVLTRLKQPEAEHYPQKYRPLIARLDPLAKLRLYEGHKLQPRFSNEEENTLREIRKSLWKESHNAVVYEGRFGASPRVVRSILYRAAQNQNFATITPMCIFEEIKSLVKNRSIYEFLQFEPRGQYHDISLFVTMMEQLFRKTFAEESIQAMNMADVQEYQILLKRYIDHVVADIKKEKLWDAASNSYVPANEAIMGEMERILQAGDNKAIHRQSLLSRIAAFSLDHPDRSIDVGQVFQDYLALIKEHFFALKKAVIDKNYTILLAYANSDTKGLRPEEIQFAQQTFANLERDFGYDFISAFHCLQYVSSFQV
jgi:predicted Ser/Thr protein kinase